VDVKVTAKYINCLQIFAPAMTLNNSWRPASCLGGMLFWQKANFNAFFYLAVFI
jgi:hypothetical protein